MDAEEHAALGLGVQVIALNLIALARGQGDRGLQTYRVERVGIHAVVHHRRHPAHDVGDLALSKLRHGDGLYDVPYLFPDGRELVAFHWAIVERGDLGERGHLRDDDQAHAVEVAEQEDSIRLPTAPRLPVGRLEVAGLTGDQARYELLRVLEVYAHRGLDVGQKVQCP